MKKWMRSELSFSRVDAARPGRGDTSVRPFSLPTLLSLIHISHYSLFALQPGELKSNGEWGLPCRNVTNEKVKDGKGKHFGADNHCTRAIKRWRGGCNGSLFRDVWRVSTPARRCTEEGDRRVWTRGSSTQQIELSPPRTYKTFTSIPPKVVYSILGDVVG